MDERMCQYCHYIWETSAQRESHETEIQRMAGLFGKDPKDIDFDLEED